MTLSFSKYHGAGNDFIMVDNLADDDSIWQALDTETIARLCARHHGIGADGLIAAAPGQQGTDYRMAYWNADGSVAEMCGNGLRCLTRFLADLGEPVREADSISILTGAGPVSSRFLDEHTIQVAMPRPSFTPADAGIAWQGEHALRLEVPVPGLSEPVIGSAVGVGNPHFVLYNAEMWEGSEVHEIGGRLAQHRDLFPEGVNVGFARREAPTSIALVVYERGVGPTLACGSGAIAAIAVGVAEGRFEPDQRIDVRMPGGQLAVTIGADFASALLEGGAIHVYDGSVRL